MAAIVALNTHCQVRGILCGGVFVVNCDVERVDVEEEIGAVEVIDCPRQINAVEGVWLGGGRSRARAIVRVGLGLCNGPVGGESVGFIDRWDSSGG